MQMIAHTLLVAQASDVALEIERLRRNFYYLNFGWGAAWALLAIFVLMMVGRERKLKRQISSLRAMLEERQKK